MGKGVWQERPSYNYEGHNVDVGMSWLEKKLVLELAYKLNLLPEWATQKGQEKRDAATRDYQVKRAAWETQFYKAERDKREATKQEASDLIDTDCTEDL
jgi:hypothetical protein